MFSESKRKGVLDFEHCLVRVGFGSDFLPYLCPAPCSVIGVAVTWLLAVVRKNPKKSAVIFTMDGSRR